MASKRGQLLDVSKTELILRAQTASKICLLSVLALLSVFVLQCVLSVEKTEVSLILLAVQIVPFLLVSRGLWRRYWPAYAWMLFFINLYFVVIVLRLFENPSDILNALLLVILSVVFVSALLFVRWARIAEARQ